MQFRAPPPKSANHTQIPTATVTEGQEILRGTVDRLPPQGIWPPMAISDVEKMVAVGIVWGATNALMRKGALIWEAKSKLLHSSSSPSSVSSRVSLALRSCLHLILTWQYSLPLALNLSASASFFAVLGGDAPISLAVPVTNATTFAVTAVAGVFLGEETRIARALLGTLFIVLGVCLCVS